MIDLPANVYFEPNDDGWSMEQETERFQSVQAFLESPPILIIELWGSVTVVAPDGNRYENIKVQHNVNINLASRWWSAKRWLYDVPGTSEPVKFKREGMDTDVVSARRL